MAMGDMLRIMRTRSATGIYPNRRDIGRKRGMVPRWLLGLALICGMLFAPVAMASGCMAPPTGSQITSPCEESHAKQQVPSKQCHCVGACSVTDIARTNFAGRIKTPLTTIPIPVALSLGDAPLERETPPPRLS